MSNDDGVLIDVAGEMLALAGKIHDFGAGLSDDELRIVSDDYPALVGECVPMEPSALIEAKVRFAEMILSDVGLSVEGHIARVNMLREVLGVKLVS